jgi:hypothetical protein
MRPATITEVHHEIVICRLLMRNFIEEFIGNEPFKALRAGED